MKSVASNLANLKPNLEWASLPLFDRTGWKRVRFGDVVKQLKEQVNPEADGIKRYVAGEHMETENVHIRKWGTVGDGYLGPAFIRGFRKGQVLYGSRRTYLKKVAVAEWDGVTANTTFVLETDEGRMLQELLPWLMLSERFTKHSVQESKGSTNPYINFPDIAKFEFDLPPLDQQRRIAEILWAVDEVIQRSEELHTSVLKAKDFFFDQELNTGTANAPQTIQNLGAALKKIVAGKSPKASNMPASLGEYGVLKVSAAGDGRYTETENKALLNPNDFDSSIEVKTGMILVTRCNAVLTGIGRACAVEQTRPGLMLSDKTLQLIPNDEIVDKIFLLQGLRSEPYRGFIERSANGTDAKNVSQETLKASPFWLPPISVQTRISQRIDEFAKAASAISKNIGRQREFRETLTNTTFL